MCAAKRVWEAREIETSRRFRGECNGCENECQGVAPESSRQATLRSPSDLGGLHIRNRNNQRHVLLQRYAGLQAYTPRA